MRPATLLVLSLMVVSCAPEPVPTQPEPAPRAALQHDRIESIYRDELCVRFPNSHASLLSGHAMSLCHDLRRGRILNETLAVARAIDAAHTQTLLDRLATTFNDECRAIVLCRVLATAGVPGPKILQRVPPEFVYESYIEQAIIEGQTLRELL